MSFIYCIDKEYSNTLGAIGYHFIKELVSNGDTYWIFANNGNIKSFTFDKSKIFFSNKLTF